jgi:hypothetical protein
VDFYFPAQRGEWTEVRSGRGEVFIHQPSRMVTCNSKGVTLDLRIFPEHMWKCQDWRLTDFVH